MLLFEVLESGGEVDSLGFFNGGRKFELLFWDIEIICIPRLWGDKFDKLELLGEEVEVEGDVIVEALLPDEELCRDVSKGGTDHESLNWSRIWESGTLASRLLTISCNLWIHL